MPTPQSDMSDQKEQSQQGAWFVKFLNVLRIFLYKKYA